MAEELMRTHIMLPKALVEAVDQLVGHRKRSAFLVQAVEEKLAHERLGQALAMTRGYLDKDAHPEWATPEKTSAWVREMRAIDAAATARKLRESA
jgi:predicted transcriptional regulator